MTDGGREGRKVRKGENLMRYEKEKDREREREGGDIDRGNIREGSERKNVVLNMNRTQDKDKSIERNKITW